MKLTIIGASGQGKVVAEIAFLCGYDEIEFLDDNENLIACGEWPVVGTSAQAQNIDNDIFVAIGNATIREKLMEEFGDKNAPILIHPSAVVSPSARIGKGTVVMAGAVINPDVIIGEGCIVNTCASIDHDCSISDYVHVSVGAHICGSVDVGKNTWIGAGAIVSNGISIIDNCCIGAGAVVIKNIAEKGTYVGVPAYKMNEISKVGGSTNLLDRR